MKRHSLIRHSLLAATCTVAASAAMAGSQATESSPGTVNPLPATSPLEGTAADHTAPGATPVRGTNADSTPSAKSQNSAAPGTVNPMPATSPLEGTKADHSLPGSTAVRGTNAQSAPASVTSPMSTAGPGLSAQYRASRLIGRSVKDSDGNARGTVRDVLISNDGQVSGIVIASGNGRPREKMTHAQPSNDGQAESGEGTPRAKQPLSPVNPSVSEMRSASASASEPRPVKWDVQRWAAPWSALHELSGTGALVVDSSALHAVTGTKIGTRTSEASAATGESGLR